MKTNCSYVESRYRAAILTFHPIKQEKVASGYGNLSRIIPESKESNSRLSLMACIWNENPQKTGGNG